MTTEVHMERFEEARKAVMVMLKAGQAMRAFGKVAMPDSLRADESLMGVSRSEVASVLEFFGELIDEHTTRASALIDQVGTGDANVQAGLRRAA